MISGLNHITLAVSNRDRSVKFYRDLLGCTLAHTWENGAYLEAGDLWICLSVCPVVDRHDDYTHVAFTATPADFALLRQKFNAHCVRYWKDNSSEGDSLYVLDPDGHKLEIHVGSLESRLQHIRAAQQFSSDCGTGH